MKPFLILQLRPLDAACENELQAILKYGGLKEGQYRQIRMEQNGIPDLDLRDYSGIIIGGGPSNVSDPLEKKGAAQIKFEADLQKLYKQLFELDFPLLGTCYGVGSIADYLGCKVSCEKYSADSLSCTTQGPAPRPTGMSRIRLPETLPLSSASAHC